MKTCLFVLTGDGPAIADRIRSLRGAGGDVAAVRPVYEVPAPADGHADLRAPMDYLSAADLTGIHAELEQRQRDLPSIRLATGETLAAWRGGLDAPPSIWVWLTALVPYWHVTLRLVRTLERIVERERPDSYDILTGDPDAAWLHLVIERVFTARWPGIEPAFATVSAAEPPRPPALPAPPDLGALRTTLAAERARAALATAVQEIEETVTGPFSCHVVLIARGGRAAAWYRSLATGDSLLIDEYSERMPDALVEACRAAGARLTIVFEGPKPVYSAANPGYADRYPSFVGEIGSDIFARISSAMRKEVQAWFVATVARMCADPAFQACFTFGGVNLFGIFEAYLARSIANLATLHVTQHEAWRAAITALRPDVLVGGRLEAKPWISLAAHGAGAKTASIKLGIGEEMMPSMIAIDDGGAYAMDSYPDAFLVWGEEQARYLTGRLPEYRGEVVPAGRARTDTFVIEASALDAARTRERLDLPADADVILYGANYRSRYGRWPEQAWGSVCFSRESYVACFDALVATAKELGGLVLVKPHPSDDLDFIAECVDARGAGRARLLLPSAGFHNVEVIGACDIFVSTVSSMFSEAATLGRVSVNIWRPDINMIYERGRWDKYNAIAHGVEDFAAMAAAVKRFLRDPDAYRAEVTRALGNLERYFGGSRGDNALNAARAVIALGQRSEKADRHGKVWTGVDHRGRPHGEGLQRRSDRVAAAASGVVP